MKIARMLLTAALAVILIMPLHAGSAYAQKGEAPLNNADIIKLSKLDLGNDIVIAKINQAKAVDFKLDIDSLSTLKRQGVSREVIAAMLKRSSPDLHASDAQSKTTGTVILKTDLEPEFEGAFCSLNSATGNINPLERQTSLIWTHQRAFGLGGSYTYYKFTGERSPIRFTEGQKIAFLVRAASQQQDPQTITQLFVCYIEDGDRRIQIDSGGFDSVSFKMHESLIAFDASKYGTSSFKITPKDQLKPGEYVFRGRNNKDWFCFGIDPKPSN